MATYMETFMDELRAKGDVVHGRIESLEQLVDQLAEQGITFTKLEQDVFNLVELYAGVGNVVFSENDDEYRTMKNFYCELKTNWIFNGHVKISKGFHTTGFGRTCFAGATIFDLNSLAVCDINWSDVESYEDQLVKLELLLNCVMLDNSLQTHSEQPQQDNLEIFINDCRAANEKNKRVHHHKKVKSLEELATQGLTLTKLEQDVFHLVKINANNGIVVFSEYEDEHMISKNFDCELKTNWIFQGFVIFHKIPPAFFVVGCIIIDLTTRYSGKITFERGKPFHEEKQLASFELLLKFIMSDDYPNRQVLK